MSFPVPRYKIGDLVWYGSTSVEQRQHPCPDCLGKGTWHVRSPAGGVYEAPCPRCQSIYQSNSGLSLNYSAHEPYARPVTIGSVRIDTASDDPVEYMCVETGIGSGQVYRERLLHHSKEEAMMAAKLEAVRLNETIPWIKERYNQSVRFCDYELRPAVAEIEKAEVSKLQWQIHDLLNDFRDCETMEHVREVLDREENQ